MNDNLLYSANENWGYVRKSIYCDYPAIESINPDKTVLLFCGLIYGFDLFGFTPGRFSGVDRFSFPDLMLVNESYLGVCLEKISRASLIDGDDKSKLEEELKEIKAFQLRLKKEIGLRYRSERILRLVA